LLTGKPPYGGKSPMDRLMAHRQAPIPSLASARPDVPRHIDRAFQKMLAKNPNDRFADMGQVAEALEEGEQGIVERHAAIVVAAAIMTAVLAGLAVWSWLR
jgi:serine/threonine-protein kinase